MTKVNRSVSKKTFQKCLKNPLILRAIKDILIQIKPLLAESWSSSPSYYYSGWEREWDSKTNTFVKKKTQEKRTYGLVSAIDATEHNTKLRNLVEAAMGYSIFGDQWFEEWCSLYTWNSNNCKSVEQAVQAVEKAIEFIDNTAKNVKPPAEAIKYVKPDTRI